MQSFLNALMTAKDVALVLLAFSMIIVIHEAGHFLAAKWAKIRVLAFAVGFGPALVSFRKGLGVQAGSSAPEYDRLAKQSGGQVTAGVRNARGGPVSPTEYRLNVLPFGGYVKMLGQDDADPGATSDAPDSYQRCKPWKRMIVISAGVVMNVLLAAGLFILVFKIGLKTEPPRVGFVEPDSPAAAATAANAAALGVTEPGLMGGDEIVSIDGRKPNSFNDLTLASAMARKSAPLSIVVQRDGVAAPLRFAITPKVNDTSKMQEIGVGPMASTLLPTAKTPEEEEHFAKAAAKLGLTGLRSGMRLTRVNDVPVANAYTLDHAVTQSGGAPVRATFVGSAGREITVSVRPRPRLQEWPLAADAGKVSPRFEHLLGLVPVLRVNDVSAAGEKAGLAPGDVFVRLGALEWPSLADGITEIRAHKGRMFSRGAIRVIVLRRGGEGGPWKEVDLGELPVSRKGTIGFAPDDTTEIMSRVTAWPRKAAAGKDAATPSGAGLSLPPGASIRTVAGEAVNTLADVRGALRRATKEALDKGSEQSTIDLVVQAPIAGVTDEADRPVERIAWTLSRAEIEDLHGLGWASSLDLSLFNVETIQLRAADPGGAIRMGLQETHRVMMTTYLTFARLVQGSVKVEHLKGPVGIAHVGTILAERGYIWLLFFMALVSVNLAVINFLPLPIADGGHFVYLLYEQITGRPVSPAVQNAAALVGVVLLAGVFLIVTYNDVVHLFG